ncbi:hypothetical protein EVAR_35782_1 [Eumeta japonica]|uniref:Uncharacterized protein n=1 Tax=Eumeta variegata TaxID=151549 RepID=A0A4C1WNJ5_EUMVA|nr:hypothetical protein EVAR_35782_1 [Eumeta japonica]
MKTGKLQDMTGFRQRCREEAGVQVQAWCAGSFINPGKAAGYLYNPIDVSFLKRETHNRTTAASPFLAAGVNPNPRRPPDETPVSDFLIETKG